MRRADTAYIAFCDSDVLPGPGWLGPLVAQFADPAVALAAPRALSAAGDAPGPLARYEKNRSPLDMGAREAPVIPLSQLAYVPAAAMVVRMASIGDGFAPELRFAEDVDLCLRLYRAGWQLRYVPAVHENRAGGCPAPRGGGAASSGWRWTPLTRRPVQARIVCACR